MGLTATQGDIDGLFVCLFCLPYCPEEPGEVSGVALSSGGDLRHMNIWKEVSDSPEQTHSPQDQGCELTDTRDATVRVSRRGLVWAKGL